MLTQQCMICGQQKQLTEFRIYAGVRRTECKQCETVTKRCVYCEQLKPVEQYGTTSYCVECVIQRAKDERRATADSKQCEVCQQTKTTFDFRRSRIGWQAVCSECEKTHNHCESCNSIKPIIEFRKSSRNSTGHSKHCKECINESRTEKEWEWYKQYCRNRRKTDAEFKNKERARSAVNVAVKKGGMARPATCQHPGKYAPQCGGRIEAHHYMGYAREHWLSVEWLCETCHTAADAIKPPDPTQE